MIYLDNMASTPVAPVVAEKMMTYLTDKRYYANASSRFCPTATMAREAIEMAKQQVASLIKAKSPESITFTSGATESNNLALQGIAHAYQQKGKHIITSMTEHASILDCLSALQKQGFSVTYLQPDESGLISAASLQAAMRDDTILVSIMWVNNEIGVIQDVQALASVCRQANVLFHVDAVQAAGKCELDMQTVPVDCMSLSAHKCYGPKGIGALYLRPESRLRLQPLMYGGSQQNALRPGTLPTHQIVGFGEAAALASTQLADEIVRLAPVQQAAWARVEAITGARSNGDLKQRVVHNVHFSLPGIVAEAFALQLAEHNICVATGAACYASGQQPSHVLRALGRTVDEARAGLRLSLGRDSTLADIQRTFDVCEQLL